MIYSKCKFESLEIQKKDTRIKKKGKEQVDLFNPKRKKKIWTIRLFYFNRVLITFFFLNAKN